MDTIEIAGRLFESKGTLMARLNLGYSTMNRYVSNGRLPKPKRIGADSYFERAEVDRMVIETW